MKARMQNSSALLKQEFLKKWIKSIDVYGNFNKNMTILERQKAIKLSADAAIASTRNTATRWSRAVLNDVDSSGIITCSGRKLRKTPSRGAITCSNKILRKTRIRRVVPRSRVVKASCVAKRLVKSRTRVLKSLVPGGKELDEVSLIKETLDYIISLRAQVDVMRDIALAAERIYPSTTTLYI